MNEETKQLFIDNIILLIRLEDAQGLSELVERIYQHGLEIGILKGNAKINQIKNN